ncbi:amine oxidase [Colletotrichum tofieldiae]|nr:amine oxidase [Colletotrichum tofieldiae]
MGQRKDGSWPDSFRGQVEQAVANITRALISGGGYPRDIVQLRFYVVEWTESLTPDLIGPVADFLRNDYGISHKPLTTLLPVSKLAFPEAKFEIEAIARVGVASKTWPSTHMTDKLYQPSVSLSPIPEVEVDVIVVGGGFSGLMAAYEVSKAGHKTLLLEAKNRIGGRSFTQPLRSTPDAVIDMGAAWINKNIQPTIYALCEKFSLETIEQYTTGDIIEQDHDGNIYPSERNNRKSDAFPRNENVSLSKWVEIKGLWQYPEVRGACEWLCFDVVGRGSDEVGIHYFLDHLQFGSGIETIATKGDVGPQSFRVKKGIASPAARIGNLLTSSGTSAISDVIANDMPAGSIMLNSPVGEIVQRNNGEAYVTTGSGFRCKAKKVILAIPTNAYSQIHFTPPLPQNKRSMVTKAKPVIYSKVVLSYTAPWWREAGLAGKFQSSSGPICFSWDACDLEAKQYSLALFVVGKFAPFWHDLSKLEREEAIVEHLAMLVGSELAPKARSVKEINMVEWSEEEYVWGVPKSSIGSGLLMKYGEASRESFGDVYFGGSETACEWKGYLEGALAAGRRAAGEVIESLNKNE